MRGSFWIGLVLGACVAAPEQAVRGVPDSGVWFDDSSRLRVSTHWVHDLPPGYSSGSSCTEISHDALTLTQKDYLSALRLLPLNTDCDSDGYVYDELIVFGVGDTSATYRSTGCPYLGVPDAGALLPSGVWAALGAANDAGCP
jgi:hypothetical protein